MAIPVLMRMKVQDHERWRAVFEAKSEARKAAGSLGAHIFRNVHDPAEVIVNVQWEDDEHARSWYASDQYKQALNEAGVIGVPDLLYLEDAGRTAN